MSSGEYDKAALVRVIQEVQDLIEGCIQRYMNKIECKHALHFHHKIDPYITELIWHRLEKENQEFFRAYYIRLLLIEQIKKFNMLLEEQVKRMHTIALSGVPPMHTSEPCPVLNRQQASPSAAARKNRPLEADMQKLHVLHNFGLSIQPSPQGFGNVPFCDSRNTQAYSVVVADVPSGAPQDTVPLRTVEMQQQLVSHDFGSSIQSQNLRMGDVPYPAPQCPISYGAGPSNQGYFQENVYMSGYDPNFGSSHNLVHSQNQDAKMTQTERSTVITREAVYDGSFAFNPSTYGNLVNLSPLTGDASINSLSSDASNATNLNELSLEENGE